MANSDEQRGVEADRLIRNPMLREAFQVIEERLVSELAVLEITDERRTKLQMLLALGRKYRTYLEQVVKTGELATLEEQRKRTLAEMAGRAIERIRDRY
jgi:hypothetical protein